MKVVGHLLAESPFGELAKALPPKRCAAQPPGNGGEHSHSNLRPTPPVSVITAATTFNTAGAQRTRRAQFIQSSPGTCW